MRLYHLIAVLALMPLAQDPPPTPPDAPAKEAQAKPFTLSDSERAKQLAKDIEGPWQLQRADWQEASMRQGDAVGFALFHDGYLAIEIHGRGLNLAPGLLGEFFQTGFHRYQFDPIGRLQTFSMIGVHNLTPDTEVEYEVPGQRREFTVQLVEDSLTLTRADGTRLSFLRLGKLPFPGALDPERDMFGRKRPESDDEETEQE